MHVHKTTEATVRQHMHAISVAYTHFNSAPNPLSTCHIEPQVGA